LGQMLEILEIVKHNICSVPKADLDSVKRCFRCRSKTHLAKDYCSWCRGTSNNVTSQSDRARVSSAFVFCVMCFDEIDSQCCKGDEKCDVWEFHTTHLLM